MSPTNPLPPPVQYAVKEEVMERKRDKLDNEKLESEKREMKKGKEKRYWGTGRQIESEGEREGEWMEKGIEKVRNVWTHYILKLLNRLW